MRTHRGRRVCPTRLRAFRVKKTQFFLGVWFSQLETFIIPPSSSFSSSSLPAPLERWSPPSSGRTGSRRPHDPPETSMMVFTHVNTETPVCRSSNTLGVKGTCLIFLWVHLLSSWREIDGWETGGDKGEKRSWDKCLKALPARMLKVSSAGLVNASTQALHSTTATCTCARTSKGLTKHHGDI